MMQSSRYSYYHPSRSEAKEYAQKAYDAIKAEMDVITAMVAKSPQYKPSASHWEYLQQELIIAMQQLELIAQHEKTKQQDKIIENGYARDAEMRAAGERPHYSPGVTCVIS